MDLNNKKRKGGVALASRRLGRVEKGQPLILGANKMEGGYNFAVEASEDSEVSLLLYKKRGAAAPVEIVFPKDFHTGRVWALKLCSASLKEFEYNYKIDGEIVQDPYAYGLHGREHFGVPYDPEKEVRCRFLNENVSGWENETAPAVEYENMILYKLHVRGYTKLARKMVSHKGTFLGLTEMIPYWKELGINAIELMPAYEFMEISRQKEPEGLVSTKGKKDEVNYWGYGNGLYFAPKRSYCATKLQYQRTGAGIPVSDPGAAQERYYLYHGILFSGGNRQPDGSSSPAVLERFLPCRWISCAGRGL